MNYLRTPSGVYARGPGGQVTGSPLVGVEALPERRRDIIRRAEKGSVRQVHWKALCDFYGNICLCCQEKTTLTKDHVIPRCRGGEHHISNIQPLCFRCNQKKGAKIIDYRTRRMRIEDLPSVR